MRTIPEQGEYILSQKLPTGGKEARRCTRVVYYVPALSAIFKILQHASILHRFFREYNITAN